MKKILLTALVLAGFSATAQVKVGNDPTNLATDANLQVEATNGSQFFIHRTSGIVGIGTTAPQSLLHIADANSNTPLMIENTSAGGRRWGIAAFGTIAGFGTGGLGFGDYSGGGWKMFLDASGNFGIGTTNPTSKLTVAGTTLSENVVVGELTGANPKQMIMGYDTTNNIGSIQPLQQLLGYTNLALNPSGGNVGIGTTNPFGKLDVNGNIVLDYIGSDYTHIRFGHDAHDMIITDNTAAKTYGGGYFFRVTNAGGSAIEAIQIHENGNVGVGILPDARLSVAGQIQMLDGNQAAGKLMVSDANGKATWTAAATALGAASSKWTNDATNTRVALTNLSDGTTARTAGTEFVVTDAGNVGIGTAAPLQPLHVIGNSHLLGSAGANDDKIIANNDPNNYFLGQYAVSGSAGLNINWHGGIRLSTSVGTALQVLQDGNVGIGTTTPSVKLDVRNGSNAVVAILGTSSSMGLQVVSGDDSVINGMVSRLGMFYSTTSTTASNGYIDFKRGGSGTDGFLSFGANGADVMTIANNGKVGIGTANPGFKLHTLVNGDDRIAIESTVDQNVGFAISKNVSGGSNNIGWQLYNPGTTTDLRIYSGAVGDVVNINAAGNFGIGTLNPTSKLTVAGTTLSDNVVVGESTGANPKQMIMGYDTTNNTGSIQPLQQLIGYTNLALNPSGGNVGIGTLTPTSKLQVVGLPVYVDNAAALAGGLTAGAFFHAGDGIVRVVF